MKKIYIFAAVLALLTLSLNAQNDVKKVEDPCQPKATVSASKNVTKPYKGKNVAPTINELLASINGMSGILPTQDTNGRPSAKGQSRAPMKINAGETTLGPFEGDNFSTNGIGYPDAYGTYGQGIDIFADLDRSKLIDFDGKEIVGFRFALAGSSSQTAVLYDFMAWPYSNNGWFEAANRHTWSIPELAGAQPITIYDDITITVGSGDVNFYSITVYGENDIVLSRWTRDTTTTSISLSGQTYGLYDIPDGWSTSQYFLRWRDSSLGYLGYLNGAGTITISSDLLAGHSNVRVTINASTDDTSYGITVNNDSRTLTSTLNDYTWSIPSTGTAIPSYIELQAGQWHEYYLDEPITFSVADTIAGMYLGYSYYQFPSTETDYLLYPIAVNPNSTVTDHVSYRYGPVQSTGIITGWDYATDGRVFPSTWTVPSVGGSGTLSGSLWFDGSSSSGGTFTIPSTVLQGNSTVTVKVTAGKENSNTHSIRVNGVSQALTEALVEYTFENVDATSNITITYSDYYVDISSIQIEGTTTTYQSGWWTENYSQYGDLAVQLIFKDTNPELAISPADQTIDDNAAGTLTVTGTDIDGNISVSAANDWYLNPTSLSSTGGDVTVTYTGRDLSASTTVTASATGATDATATVNYVADLYIVTDNGQTGNWDFTNGTHMSYNNGIYTATFTANADNTFILFARMLGNGVTWNTRYVFGPDSDGDWWLNGDSGSGTIDTNDDDPIKIVNGGTYTVTIDATNGTFTITRVPEGQTATPTISYTVSDEYVTITATGDGTVTLNVPGYDPVSDEGSVSITIPRGYASNTITVTATAKEDGKTESAPASEQITIPAGSGWTEMDGTYSANDLLSFTVGGEDIMLVDQFMASTLNNAQPDHYTYTLRQTVNGETQTSSPVDIPVYKTNSSIQGLYTQNQVDGDTDMGLKAGVLNTEMDYDVNPDHNVLYYSLYRSGLNQTYPAIDVPSRISQLQKFEDNTSGTVQYFMYENHTSGVAPRYDHLGNEIAERLDTNWVYGAYNDQLAYVPVIWTFGLYSGREDGKNNSYGSDIKREYLGKVEATISGEYTAGNAYGTWDVNGTEYCVFHPTINVTGYLPQEGVTIHYNDGDEATYVPYKCRAWCTTEGIHDFVKDSEGHLTDNGTLDVPYLLGEAEFGSDLTATIGGDWTGLDNDPHSTDVRDQWSFGLPSTTNPASVTYIIRFYYKKVVTEGNAGTGSKLRDGDSQEFFITQTSGTIDEWVVGLNELNNYSVVESVTYVNPQGMQSSRPFDGVNIVVTRYSDGTTRTTKIIR